MPGFEVVARLQPPISCPRSSAACDHWVRQTICGGEGKAHSQWGPGPLILFRILWDGAFLHMCIVGVIGAVMRRCDGGVKTKTKNYSLRHAIGNMSKRVFE